MQQLHNINNNKTGQINYRPIERQSLQENEHKTPTLQNNNSSKRHPTDPLGLCCLYVNSLFFTASEEVQQICSKLTETIVSFHFMLLLVCTEEEEVHEEKLSRFKRQC